VPADKGKAQDQPATQEDEAGDGQGAHRPAERALTDQPG
jgi:hypothetical protein